VVFIGITIILLFFLRGGGLGRCFQHWMECSGTQLCTKTYINKQIAFLNLHNLCVYCTKRNAVADPGFDLRGGVDFVNGGGGGRQPH